LLSKSEAVTGVAVLLQRLHGHVPGTSVAEAVGVGVLVGTVLGVGVDVLVGGVLGVAVGPVGVGVAVPTGVWVGVVVNVAAGVAVAAPGFKSAR
jgi:hypothetical protein